MRAGAYACMAGSVGVWRMQHLPPYPHRPSRESCYRVRQPLRRHLSPRLLHYFPRAAFLLRPQIYLRLYISAGKRKVRRRQYAVPWRGAILPCLLARHARRVFAFVRFQMLAARVEGMP